MTITDTNIPEIPPEDDSPHRKAWRAWFHREPGTEVAVWESPSEEVTPWAWVDKHALKLPDRRHVTMRLKHLGTKIPGILIKLPFKGIKLLWYEGVGPIYAGVGKCVGAYTRWVIDEHRGEAAKAAEGPLKARLGDSRSKAHNYRIWASLIGATMVAGGMAYLYFAHYLGFWVTIIMVLGIVDLIGRQNQKPKEFAPRHREPLHEGMSYRELTASIQDSFNEIVGVDESSNPLVRVDGVASKDFDKQEYKQNISTYQEIKDEHIRTLERHIGAAARSIKILEVPKVATRRIVVIKMGDPLAVVPPPPDYPTGSLTITEPLTIGVSTVPQPFALYFGGVHMGVTGATGSAKTKVHMRNIINVLSVCRDVVIYGIDLQNGPEFSLWKGVIQKKAFTPEDADQLLDDIIEELYRRMEILNRIAEDDDPTNDDNDDEWRSDLGPYLVVLIDEFPVLAEFNGKAGKLDLLGKVTTGMRLGRKVGVSFIRAAQATGTQDSGTTVLHKQTAVNIVGPCSLMDTDAIFTPEKRKAGYTPHYLVPADLMGSINDAGKCYINAGGFGPDEYRGFAPLSTSEVKRRARQRVADGLPQVDIGNNTEDAKLVPNTLAALAAALDGIEPPDGRLPSRMAAEWITEHSNEELSADELAKRLKDELGDKAPKAENMRNKLRANCRCYLAEDINRVMGEL
jgi:hypothetical protein